MHKGIANLGCRFGAHESQKGGYPIPESAKAFRKTLVPTPFSFGRLGNFS